MSLERYRHKRDFAQTPEPRGRGDISPGNRFVIHKHAATRLHYDLRLELAGALKSWAVPKGPSLSPADKRLAVEVEDHPLEYVDFEGIIPEGQYGAGAVIVWDRGSWQAKGDPHEGYARGKLDFVLAGEKLRGAWTLVRKRGATGEHAPWFWIKQRDAHARSGSAANVTLQLPRSVLSGRDLEQVARAPKRVWSSEHNGADRSRTLALAAKAARGAVTAPMPRHLSPELASAARSLVGSGPWLLEIKLDGYRLQARLANGRLQLLTRRGQDWTDQLGVIGQELLERFGSIQMVLDGELVALDAEGRSRFQLLQAALADPQTAAAPLFYYVFDLLYLQGYDLRGAPLAVRRHLLQQVLEDRRKQSCRVRLSQTFSGPWEEVLAHACRLGLEGVIAKRARAPYREQRTTDWQKLKCHKRQEAVVVGYSKPQGSRVGIGALLLAVHEDGQLRYAGKVGTGFSQATLGQLLARLEPLQLKRAPVKNPPPGSGIHWVRPEMVVEVEFTEWTRDGRLRHPSFVGERADKAAREVVRENPI